MALSPKQKKIAKMAGDPNKIEGDDFKKLKTMKADVGEGVDTAKKHKKYIKDKAGTIAGYASEMVRPLMSLISPAGKTAKAKEVGKTASPAVGATSNTMKYFKENASKDKDRLTEKDQEFVNDFAGGAKMGGVMKAKYGKMVMARGCKMGKNKPTKLS